MLVEVTAEKVVIERKVTLGAGRAMSNLPAEKSDVPAKIDPDPSLAPEPGHQSKESTEDVEVLGRKIKCKVVENSVSDATHKSMVKIWTSDEIPGQTVMSEDSMEKPMQGHTKTTITAMTLK
jgi:hypothetical protein